MTDIVNNKHESSAEEHHDTDDLHELFPPRPNLAALRNMRILLVDDLPTNIILAQAILEHGGFSNVITTESGDKALNVLEKHTRDGSCDIDVVLLDIILPGKNGYSVCRSIRKHKAWGHIPVIMVTSDTKWKEETALAAFDSGATDILFKPIRSAELIPRVISALSLKTERDSRLQSEKYYRETNNEHALLEARLKYLVGHDEKTGLYNRRRLEQLLELSILYSRDYKRESALVCLDIDHFRQINAEHGYEVGDRLIEEIAGLLQSFAGDDYHAARIATDKYALLIEDCSKEIAVTIAKRLARILDEHHYRSVSAQVTTRIGLAFIEQDVYTHPCQVIARAEDACHNAKNSTGRINCLYND